jgi:Predicted membrane protein (DUF2207)
MPESTEAGLYLLPGDWICVLGVFGIYAAVLIALRREAKGIQITEYGPPAAITPAMAGFLWNDCTFERAFVAALISLGWKGYLQIRQNKDWYFFDKLREPDSNLPFEESLVLSALFFPESVHTYKFNSRDCTWLLQAYKKFTDTMIGAAEPELVSEHQAIWYAGIALSLAALIFLFRSAPVLSEQVSVASIIYLGVFVAVGGSACIAALRAWPATLQKLSSYVRRDGRPRRPLEAVDLAPVVLTASSLLGLGFLGALTSVRFALLVTLLFVGSAIFRNFLKTPTLAGRRIRARLRGYREFLTRAEADRLNRENEPGSTPDMLENCTAYAVALDVEHGWGEEFVENLLEMIQFDAAYSVGAGQILSAESPLGREFDILSSDIIQLHIPRKRK